VSEPPNTRRWRRPAGAIFVLLAFLFLGYFVASNLDALREHRWTVRPGLLALSLLLHIAGLAWGVLVWRLLLRQMGIQVPLLGLMRVWFISGLGRYIPGKIWQFVGAAHLAGDLGVRAGATVTALAVHTGFFLVAAVLLSVYLLPSAIPGAAGAPLTLLWTLAPMLLLLLHPRVIGGALGLFRRATGRQLAEWTGTWTASIGLAALAMLGWTITGAAFHLFVQSLTPLPSSALPAMIGVNALSFVIGYAVIVAPAGLGAKEVSLAALLALYVPPPVAALLAIAARLWTMAAEAIPALLLLFAGKSAPGTEARTPSAPPLQP
jgi:glycosyltransferase 2 family protein